jgi:hypothetical protein
VERVIASIAESATSTPDAWSCASLPAMAIATATFPCPNPPCYSRLRER